MTTAATIATSMKSFMMSARKRGNEGVSKSFQQFSLSGTNAFGVGFSLWLRICFDLWRSDIKIGNMLQQLVAEQSRVQVGPDIKTFA